MAPDIRHREPRRELRRDVVLTALLGAAVAFVVVAPLTRRGWLLLLDWAPGPRGIGPTGASAIPTGPLFTVPASAAHVLFGAAASWLPLAVALAVATAGGAQLVGGPWAARAATGVAYAWNPFVFDRIAAGQFSVLAGYALLPWLTGAAVRASRRRDAVIVGAWWSAAALCSVHFLWIGGLIVVAVAATWTRTLPVRRVLGALGIATAVVVVLVGPWLAIAHESSSTAGTPKALSSFATKPDPDLGRSLGLLAEQGFWRPVVTRPRDDLGGLFPFVACAVVAAAGCGLVFARRTRLAGTVTLAGFAGWVLAHGSAGPAGSLYRVAFTALPGFAVMREAQKWSALVCLAIAVGLGCLAAAIARGPARRRRMAWLVVVAPIACAPTLAWGLAGRVAPSRYPAEWAAVRAAVNTVPGDVIALPFEHYSDPGITRGRAVASVAPRYFGPRVIVSDDARTPGLPGDRGRRARIALALAEASADARAGRPLRLGSALAALGVRGVLVVGPDGDVPLARDRSLVPWVDARNAQLWVVASPADDRQ